MICSCSKNNPQAFTVQTSFQSQPSGSTVQSSFPVMGLGSSMRSGMLEGLCTVARHSWTASAFLRLLWELLRLE